MSSSSSAFLPAAGRSGSPGRPAMALFFFSPFVAEFPWSPCRRRQ